MCDNNQKDVSNLVDQFNRLMREIELLIKKYYESKIARE